MREAWLALKRLDVHAQGIVIVVTSNYYYKVTVLIQCQFKGLWHRYFSGVACRSAGHLHVFNEGLHHSQ